MPCGREIRFAVRAAAICLAAVRASALATPWNGNATAPRQLHLALTEAADGMLFSWTTGTPIWAPPASAPNATSPAVRIGRAPGAYDLTVTSNYSLMYAGVGDVTHRVNVSGLLPRTRYWYVVGDVELQQWSAEASFVSRPPVGKDEVIDFIAYGGKYKAHRAQPTRWIDYVRVASCRAACLQIPRFAPPLTDP
jgi:hypothetical protein